jgi:hypothetical protein
MSDIAFEKEFFLKKWMNGKQLQKVEVTERLLRKNQISFVMAGGEQFQISSSMDVPFVCIAIFYVNGAQYSAVMPLIYTTRSDHIDIITDNLGNSTSFTTSDFSIFNGMEMFGGSFQMKPGTSCAEGITIRGLHSFPTFGGLAFDCSGNVIREQVEVSLRMDPAYRHLPLSFPMEIQKANEIRYKFID